MTLKIVTDSTADLPPQLAKELGITVVPVYVRFGNEIYRDRVDISEEEFYLRLLHDPVVPSTSEPSPQDFADVYQKLAEEADGIVSIHVSSKLSGTCNSALRGREMIEKGCPIEVVDSLLVTMALGLLVLAATIICSPEKNLQRATDEIKQIIPGIHLLGLLDTLKYLALGGRIGRAKALLGSVLNVKPLLTLKDGEVVPVGQVRTRDTGRNRLFDFAKNATAIEDLAIVYSTTPDEANILADGMTSLFPRERVRIARLGPALGAHCGPNILFLALRGKVP